MENPNAIELQHISKKFKIYSDKGWGLKERILFKDRNRYEERVVLNDLSFCVKKGESIGIIGKNGCGKSTTLKLLAKIIYPNKGTVSMHGRVSSLIELGAGFHPDLSGKENIYTNASIFGLSKREISSRLEKIIEFSEIEEFIDNPVRTYSSGMYMRLAFSVAINVDADILLIDEILAVGDLGFQQKCMEKLKEIKSEGTTIVIVSHSLGQIEQICDRTIWLENGNIREDGICRDVHMHYQQEIDQKSFQYSEKSTNRNVQIIVPSFYDPKAVSWGNKKIYFTDVILRNEIGKECSTYSTGSRIEILLKYKSLIKNLNVNFGIAIYRSDGIHCFGTHMVIEKNITATVSDQGIASVIIEKLELLSGIYYIDVGMISETNEVYEEIKNVKQFKLICDKQRQGICNLDTKWIVDGKIY